VCFTPIVRKSRISASHPVLSQATREADLPGVPKGVAADRGYTSHAFRQYIWDMGFCPTILPLRHEAPVACPD